MIVLEKNIKNETGVSKSKQKRIERDKKLKNAKLNSQISKIIWVVIGIAIIAAIAAFIAYGVNSSAKDVAASEAYSDELLDNGFIKGVKATDYITLPDYKNLKVPYSEIEYTDEEFNEEIKNTLSSHKELDTSIKDAIKDGDTVDIDFVGSIDGVEFDGGSSNGQGYELTIGSHSFIDDFEEQLIGYKPGEVVNVNVDFPEDYGSEELAGKNADFVVNINGFYVDPELTDDFVAQNLSEYATTVDGYREYLKKTNEEIKLHDYVDNYVIENSVVKKFPKNYLNNIKSVTRFADEEAYQYMNQMYMQYYGTGVGSFEDYTGMDKNAYLEDLSLRAQESCLKALAYQAILENENAALTEDEIQSYITENYGEGENSDSMIEKYGKGYLANEMIPEKALEIILGYAVVE